MSLFTDGYSIYNSDTQDVRQDFQGRWVYTDYSQGADNAVSIYVTPMGTPSTDIRTPDVPMPSDPVVGRPGSPYTNKVVGHWDWQFVGLDDYRANRNGYAWVETYDDPGYIQWQIDNAPKSGGLLSAITSAFPTVVGALTGIGLVGGVSTSTVIGNVATGQDTTAHLREALGIDAAGAALTGIAALTQANAIASQVAADNLAAVSPPPLIETPPPAFDLPIAPPAPVAPVAPITPIETLPGDLATGGFMGGEAIPTGLAPVAGETGGISITGAAASGAAALKTAAGAVAAEEAIRRVINPPKPPVASPTLPVYKAPIDQPSVTDNSSTPAPQVGGFDLVLLALFATKVIL